MINLAECEVCGKPISTRRKAKIDEVIFQVCEECVKLGEEITETKPKIIVKERPIIKEDFELVSDFAERIKTAREKLGLTQKELANKINESESIIKRIEHGFAETKVIRKLEKFFGIKLYQTIKEVKIIKKGKEEKLTLGDVAEVKRKV